MKLEKFDAADFIENDEDVIEYLNAALEEGDPEFFAKSVGVVMRARGMTKIAEETGLGRQNLYKAFAGGQSPTLKTLFKVLEALGIRVKVSKRDVAA